MKKLVLGGLVFWAACIQPLRYGETEAQLTGPDGGTVSPSSGIFNVADFGAACDGVGDDTAALQAALNKAIAAPVFPQVNRGGVVVIPNCTLRITGSTSVTSAIEGASLRIMGLSGSGSRILVDGNSTTIPIRLIQGQTSAAFFEVSDLIFLRPWTSNAPDNTVRSKTVLWLQSLQQSNVSVRRVQFYGMVSGEHMLLLDGGNAEVEQVGLWGCSASKTLTNSGVITFNKNWLGWAHRLIAHDYGLLDSKTYSAAGSATAGIYVIPMPTNTSYPKPRTNIVIENSEFDEGFGHHQIQLNEYGNPVYRLGLVRIRGIESNAPSPAGYRVVRASKVDHLIIEQMGVRWSYAANYAIEIAGVARAVISDVEVDDTKVTSANKLQIDSPLYPFLGKSNVVRVQGCNFTVIEGTPTNLILEP